MQLKLEVGKEPTINYYSVMLNKAILYIILSMCPHIFSHFTLLSFTGSNFSAVRRCMVSSS